MALQPTPQQQVAPAGGQMAVSGQVTQQGTALFAAPATAATAQAPAGAVQTGSGLDVFAPSGN
jgi:hypothetical protein